MKARTPIAYRVLVIVEASVRLSVCLSLVTRALLKLLVLVILNTAGLTNLLFSIVIFKQKVACVSEEKIRCTNVIQNFKSCTRQMCMNLFDKEITKLITFKLMVTSRLPFS